MPRTPVANVRRINDAVLCPSCQDRMLIERRQPLVTYRGMIAVTYRCLMCGTETTIVGKRRTALPVATAYQLGALARRPSARQGRTRTAKPSQWVCVIISRV